MIYTSYFAKIKKLEQSHITPISIALKSPDWYHGSEYKKLAPTWSILSEYKNCHDEERYRERYAREVLSRLDTAEILRDISEIANFLSDDVALICYEKPSDFCHRHLVARWLRENGVKCEEWIG